MPDTDWDAVSYVIASDYRTKIMVALLSGAKTPTELVDATELDMTYVSRTLRDLKDKDLVELLVPEETNKGRLYGLTDGGEEIAGVVKERTGENDD